MCIILEAQVRSPLQSKFPRILGILVNDSRNFLDAVVSDSKLAYHLFINSLLDITMISCSPFIRICRNPSLAYSLGQLC